MAWGGIHREASGTGRGTPWQDGGTYGDACAQPCTKGENKTRIRFPDGICQHFEDVKAIGGNIETSPWPLPTAKTAASAQRTLKVLEIAPDGSIDQQQLKNVFGMELGKTVQLKKQEKDESGPLHVYHITSIAKTITLMAAGENTTKEVNSCSFSYPSTSHQIKFYKK